MVKNQTSKSDITNGRLNEMEGVKILCHQMKMPQISSPVIELSQNTGLLLDKTLIHIPDSETDFQNQNQVPSNQVPPNQNAIQSFPSDPTSIETDSLSKNGAFPLQDSVMPFDARHDESEQRPLKEHSYLTQDPQQKTKKMKKEIHHTTATGTLPLRKINKRDATELDLKNAPKAPRSAYQIFLHYRKSKLSEEQGAPVKVNNEMVRQIGTEWSSLPKKSEIKNSFENKAEEDKQRYLRELADFLKSEPYLDFLKRKTDGQPVESIDEYIQREQESLNCLICNQIFSTSHNKKEHLLGRGHLLKLMNGFDAFQSERNGVQKPKRSGDDVETLQSQHSATPYLSAGMPELGIPSSSLRDHLHTDSSNATTEDYSWNSPSRTTLTPDISSSGFHFPLNQMSCRSQTSLSSESSAVSPTVTYSKDALLGSMISSYNPTNQATFQSANLMFDVDMEAEKEDFDMTKLDLPDDFNISHDYLNDLQSCKLEQISPTLNCQNPPLVSESSGSVDVIKQEPSSEMQTPFDSSAIALERQVSMETFDSQGDPLQFPEKPSIIPSLNEISTTSADAETYDLLDEELNKTLFRFIEQHTSRNDLLHQEREANCSLQKNQSSLKSEFEMLSQTKAKLEKDNGNLKQYGHSLEIQLQNLKNLPTLILSSRNLPTTLMNGYKSPQSDSLLGDVTSSPSTYCESSITSPMPHGNGLMSPHTPSAGHQHVVVGSLHNSHNVFGTFNHHGSSESVHGHSIYGTNTLVNRGNSNSHNVITPMPFPRTNVLNGQWSAN